MGIVRQYMEEEASLCHGQVFCMPGRPNRTMGMRLVVGDLQEDGFNVDAKRSAEERLEAVGNFHRPAWLFVCRRPVNEAMWVISSVHVEDAAVESEQATVPIKMRKAEFEIYMREDVTVESEQAIQFASLMKIEESESRIYLGEYVAVEPK
ncbi:unnamed protein product [Gongylonema pulchrum]|uniref:DUF1330 domain-containing protein n=1 Tax=Gongylonema pulchrum TaxID=637853 RepID=A0A183E0Z6_9BILA|nr:unnamed protein product [Gongylonema pulchrum]